MLSKLSLEAFTPCLHQTFQVTVSEGHVITFELIEVKPLSPSAPLSAQSWGRASEVPIRQEPFSLIFRGPLNPLLPQKLYRLEHPELGPIEGLFFVPLDTDSRGVYYESIVN